MGTRMNDRKLTQRSLLIFWLPMAATWLMMALEGPFIAAVIARLPELKVNLAAYGIAFAIGLFLEAPIMMLISASVALVRDRGSFIKLRNFMLLMNLSVTLALAVLLIPSVFRVVIVDLMNLPEELHTLTHVATMLLLAWPAAIGFRRFYQGILIRNGHTGKVATGTIVRLVGMSGTALLLVFRTDMPGAWVGCAALSAGVSLEAIATWFMARSSIRKVLKRPGRHRKKPDIRGYLVLLLPVGVFVRDRSGSAAAGQFFRGALPGPAGLAGRSAGRLHDIFPVCQFRCLISGSRSGGYG